MIPLALAAVSALCLSAAPKNTLTYRPAGDEERPVATEVTVAPDGSDFSLRFGFNKAPWGDECKNRCANVTIFLDTDNNPKTGLQIGGGAAESGTDLAVTLQGVREYKESRAIPFLRVKVRVYSADAKSVEEGESLADLDSRQDPERVTVDDNRVTVKVDATSSELPAAKQMRVVYHPPGAKPVKAVIPGMLAGGGGHVQVIKRGTR